MIFVKEYNGLHNFPTLVIPLNFKVQYSQIGSASEWYHWKGLEKDINRYRFFIFYFWFWIFEKSSKFWAASYKNASNPPTCWDHGLYGHKPQSFLPNRAPEMQEIQQLFLGLWLVSRILEENQQSAIQTKIEQHFGRFFQQIKVRQLIGRNDSKQTMISTSRRLDSFLYEAAQNFKLFSNIQDQN